MQNTQKNRKKKKFQWTCLTRFLITLTNNSPSSNIINNIKSNNLKESSRWMTFWAQIQLLHKVLIWLSLELIRFSNRTPMSCQVTHTHHSKINSSSIRRKIKTISKPSSNHNLIKDIQVNNLAMQTHFWMDLIQECNKYLRTRTCFRCKITSNITKRTSLPMVLSSLKQVNLRLITQFPNQLINKKSPRKRLR